MSRKPGQAKGFGQDIQKARIGRGWSQITLGEKAGVSRPTIARIERGDNVSTATLSKVAKALGLTVELEAE